MAFNLDLNNDEFWNETSGNKFRFEDDDLAECEVFNGEEKDLFSATSASTVIPLLSITSKENLNFILEDVRVTSRPDNCPIDEVIKNMFLGKPFQLYDFKSEEEKHSLLIKAVESSDGNIILKVILFLLKTLKSNIVYRYLANYPTALEQCASYLIYYKRIQDLELLYMATNCKNNLSQLYYLSSMDASTESQLRKLQNFKQEHWQDVSDKYEKSIFDNHRSFLEFRMKEKCEDNVVADTFAKLCSDGRENVADLRLKGKTLLLSDFKMDWVLLNVFAANEKWQNILEMFQKPNWFSRRSLAKSTIEYELVAYCLYKHDAPVHVIEEYLKKIADSDKSVYLGKKFKCHKHVIETLVSKRDRDGLIEYRNRISSNAHLLKLIDAALLNDKLQK